VKGPRVLILTPLAGTYRGGQMDRMIRKHAIYEDAPKAFCGYNADNLVDEYGMDPDDVEPTCPRCKEVFDRRLARGIIEPVKGRSKS
jgi:hypothetical protein